MDIIIGSDHAGYNLKEECKTFLETSAEYRVKDIGVFGPPQSSDYPGIAHMVAQTVSKGEYGRGILICGSGIGMSIVANRYTGVRAALCHNLYTTKMSRLHNDANILVMGDRIIDVELALEMTKLFFETGFEGGRHKSRVDQIDG